MLFFFKLLLTNHKLITLESLQIPWQVYTLCESFCVNLAQRVIVRPTHRKLINVNMKCWNKAERAGRSPAMFPLRRDVQDVCQVWTITQICVVMGALIILVYCVVLTVALYITNLVSRRCLNKPLPWAFHLKWRLINKSWFITPFPKPGVIMHVLNTIAG